MIKSRALIAFLTAVFILFFPIGSWSAQYPRRIGVLWGGRPNQVWHYREAFVRGLEKLGHVQGEDIIIHNQYGLGDSILLSELAIELVNQKVDVIVASGTPSAVAATRATREIPIVFVNVGDPVKSGLVKTMAQPGANATGLSLRAPELSAKRLEIFKESVGGISHIAVLGNSANSSHKLNLRALEPEGKQLKITIQSIEVHGRNEFERAFAEMIRAGADSVMVLPDAMFFSERQKIVQLALSTRLPAIYTYRGYVEAGGLMAYGPNQVHFYARAAIYVDKILNGAMPADLPVERPMRAELIVNLKTANAIGIKIPPEVLQRAVRVLR
jgi:ABC-type uncharacterized transport system substrate-binding protein